MSPPSRGIFRSAVYWGYGKPLGITGRHSMRSARRSMDTIRGTWNETRGLWNAMRSRKLQSTGDRRIDVGSVVQKVRNEAEEQYRQGRIPLDDYKLLSEIDEAGAIKLLAVRQEQGETRVWLFGIFATLATVFAFGCLAFIEGAWKARFSGVFFLLMAAYCALLACTAHKDLPMRRGLRR